MVAASSRSDDDDDDDDDDPLPPVNQGDCSARCADSLEGGQASSPWARSAKPSSLSEVVALRLWVLVV